MSKPPAKPHRTSEGRAQAEARARREAEALRANLKRRKQADRGRRAPSDADKSPTGRDGA